MALPGTAPVKAEYAAFYRVTNIQVSKVLAPDIRVCDPG